MNSAISALPPADIQNYRYNGSPPKAVHAYGLNKQGQWLQRGAAPILLNRQTPFPIDFSNSTLEDISVPMKHFTAFQSAGIITPVGSVVASRRCLRSIVDLREGTSLNDSNLYTVSKRGGVLFVGIDGGNGPLKPIREGFGFNFEKTTTSSVVLQDSFYVVTEMSSMLDNGTLFITCETDASDLQGRIVELKCSYRNDASEKSALTKHMMNEDIAIDEKFRSIFYQMYFGGASILKYGIIEPYGVGHKRRPHVTAIFSWTLEEVAQKAFKKNVEGRVAETLGFVKCVIQWVVDRLASHSDWNGRLVLRSTTDVLLIEDAPSSLGTLSAIKSSENKKAKASFNNSKTSQQANQQPSGFKLQYMDEIRSELSELWSDDD